MRKLLSAITACGLIGAGGVAVAGIVYMQNEPLAFTSQAPRRMAARPAAAAVSDGARAHDPAPFLPRLSLAPQVADVAVAPLVIQSHKPAKTEREPVRLVPCSEWLDMGPKAVGDSGRRRVRMLCPAGAPVSDYYEGPDA